MGTTPGSGDAAAGGRSPRTRRWAGLAAVVALVATGAIVTSPVGHGAAPAQAETAAAEVEAPDFASEAYADPWDYSNTEDLSSDAAAVVGMSVSGGRLNMTITGDSSFDPIHTIGGSIAQGRDGAAIAVDTNRYKRLSFKMNQPNSGVGAFYWFTCREMLASCAGGITFGLRPGDNVYDLPLDGASTIGAGIPWNGTRVVAVRMLPAITQSRTQSLPISFDWMRIYQPSTAHGGYPPGDFGSFSVSPLPRPVVDSPNPSEGRDLASAQGRQPWEFTSAAAAAGLDVRNARVLGFDSRGMSAQNAPPLQNDPEVRFPMTAFDASRFHHFSFDLDYDGQFSLADSPGGGKLARLIWQSRGSATYQQSDDIVTYSSPNQGEIYIDMNRGDVLDPSSGAPRLGWAGQTIESLRFDPNEDPGAAVWRLRSLHFREDPAAQGATTVRFHDDAWVPGTTAQVSVGSGLAGSAWQPIASDVAVTQGVNSVRFDLGSRAPGSYKVQVVLKHPDGAAALAFSRTAITMTRDTARDPRGAVDSIRRSPGGATVSGWSHDPDTTTPMQVHLYDNTTGQFLGSVPTGGARPDVQAGVPGAPGTTGYVAVVPLSAGRRDVCAYGINVGTGSNALLGCRSIVVDGTSVGALDDVVRIPGGVRARGWAIDPDTAASIPVHFYVGAAGTAVTADGPRPDLQRAFPDYGPAHGWVAQASRPAGTYQACAYAIGDEGGTTVGCRSVTLDGRPLGAFDALTRTSDGVVVRGWALDPDIAGAVAVHVYVDGRPAAVIRADGTRSDIGAAYPDWGSAHGWSTTIQAASGSTVCAYAIDSAGGENTTVGCRRA